jgi:hypothetical protein
MTFSKKFGVTPVCRGTRVGHHCFRQINLKLCRSFIQHFFSGLFIMLKAAWHKKATNVGSI